MNRQELIKKGKIWQVNLDASPDDILFEGNKTNCFKFVKQNYGMRQYRKGIIRVGELIWEKI
jgi:hypothetical protein